MSILVLFKHSNFSIFYWFIERMIILYFFFTVTIFMQIHSMNSRFVFFPPLKGHTRELIPKTHLNQISHCENSILYTYILIVQIKKVFLTVLWLVTREDCPWYIFRFLRLINWTKYNVLWVYREILFKKILFSEYIVSNKRPFSFPIPLVEPK